MSPVHETDEGRSVDGVTIDQLDAYVAERRRAFRGSDEDFCCRLNAEGVASTAEDARWTPESLRALLQRMPEPDSGLAPWRRA